VTQTRESIAHGRLTEADPISRAGDVKVGEESVEGDQKVEVDGSEIHDQL
jgi:hypothetical protein